MKQLIVFFYWLCHPELVEGCQRFPWFDRLTMTGIFNIPSYCKLSLAFIILIFTHCGPATPPERPLQEIAAEYNKKCPQMIDSETRLDGIEIRDNSVIVYKYTLVNLLAENVDTLEFRRALWPGILSIIKTNPAMQQLRERQTRFEYYYQDKQNHFIYSFKISPTDYKP
jgi:hypothetical protein